MKSIRAEPKKIEYTEQTIKPKLPDMSTSFVYPDWIFLFINCRDKSLI